MQSIEAPSVDLVIGSYSDGGVVTPSIYSLKAGEHTATAMVNELHPSYILAHDGYFYAVAEHQNGYILAMDKNFKVLAKVPTMGDDPCHLAIDPAGRHIVASNYTSGSFIIYRLVNHLPTSVHSFIVHEGHSNDPERQVGPHAHSAVFSECGTILFEADLGTDIVYYYDFNEEKVVWNKEKSIKIEYAGPRTVIRGKPGSKQLYLSCELDSTIRILSYKGEGLQQIMAYKLSQNPTNYLSEVQYNNGQVMVALRGDDKIMVFKEKEEALEVDYSFKVGLGHVTSQFLATSSTLPAKRATSSKSTWPPRKKLCSSAKFR